MITEILSAAPLFLLFAVRALAMIETAPLLSSDAIPQTAKVALAGFTAFAVFPTAGPDWAPIAQEAARQTLSGGTLFSLNFALMLAGEALIGVTTGFFMTIVFTTFSTAGQFFSLQMGFSAAEAFDPLAQVENPLLGQFLNLVGMLTFLAMGGLHELFLGGFWRSIQALSTAKIAAGHEPLIKLIAGGLPRLFVNAMIISLPVVGSLFLTTLAVGLVSKAVPQINMMSEGFPISTLVAFLLMLLTMRFMIDAFDRILVQGFNILHQIYIDIGGGISVPDTSFSD